MAGPLHGPEWPFRCDRSATWAMSRTCAERFEGIENNGAAPRPTLPTEPMWRSMYAYSPYVAIILNGVFVHPYLHDTRLAPDGDMINAFLGALSGNREMLAVTEGGPDRVSAANDGTTCAEVVAARSSAPSSVDGGTARVVRRLRREGTVAYPPELFDGLLIRSPNPLRDARRYLPVLKSGGMLAVLPLSPHALRREQWMRGFPVEPVRTGSGGELVARKHPQPISGEKDCAFCPELRFRLNRLELLPGATGVLWGDADFLVMPDLAPLAEGHLLVVTVRHELAMAAGGMEALGRLDRHLQRINRLFRTAYGVEAVFFEHGPHRPGTAGSCIDHAHVHALPARVSLLQGLRRSGIKMAPISLATLSTRYLARDSYLFVQEGSIRAFHATAEVPSQLMRRVYTETAGGREWRWQRMYMTDENRARIFSTLNTLLPWVDGHAEEISGRL
jgi:diadenosine tetraphosphate (Ap4A) HIT family hydrolase